MIKRILLPVDGSEHSMAAGHAALELALTHDAVVYALGVVDVPGIKRSASAVGAGASYYGRELCQYRLDEARKILGDFLDRLKEELKRDQVKVKRIHDSGPVHEIISERSRTTDLVVVSREINFEFETSDKPSDTLFEMLEISARPTLVVPDKHRPIRRVLVAHDLTRSCARVLFTLVQLHPFPGAEYVMVHADKEGKARREDFEEILGYLKEHGIEAEMVIRDIKPSQAILEVAEERAADVIVLGAYDAGKVRRLLFGSTAQRILEQAKIPLLFGT